MVSGRGIVLIHRDHVAEMWVGPKQLDSGDGRVGEGSNSDLTAEGIRDLLPQAVAECERGIGDLIVGPILRQFESATPRIADFEDGGERKFLLNVEIPVRAVWQPVPAVEESEVLAEQ